MSLAKREESTRSVAETANRSKQMRRLGKGDALRRLDAREGMCVFYRPFRPSRSMLSVIQGRRFALAPGYLIAAPAALSSAIACRTPQRS